MKEFKYEHYELPNGLIVATRRMPGTETITGTIGISAGAMYEEPNERGLAHLVEHCLHKGSSRFSPSEAKNYFNRMIDRLNATTDAQNIVLSARLLPNELDGWLNFSSDAALNPLLDEEGLNTERAAVLQELADNKSSSGYSTALQIKGSLFRGHPAGIDVGGDERVIVNAKVQDLKRYHSRLFNSNNMGLFLVGALPKNSRELIEKYLGDYPAGKDYRTKLPELAPLDKQTILKVPAPELFNSNSPGSSSARIFIEYVGAPKMNKNYFANYVLSDIISKRVFNALREKEKLVYAAGATYNTTTNFAAIGQIKASVPALKVEHAINTIFNEIKDIREKEVDPKELEQISNTTRFDLARAFESHNGNIGIMWLAISGISPRTYLKTFESITPKMVLETAQKYLPDGKENGKYVLTVYNPLMR